MFNSTVTRCLTRLVCTLALAFPLLAAGTFTVTNTADAGPGSLRQALLDANAAQGGTVAFAISTGHQRIRPLTGLPAVTDTIIDGRTQPGFSGAPLIEIDGSLTVATAHALLNVITGEVHALIVNRAPSTGIVSDRSLVTGCYLGTDATGTVALSNGEYSVLGNGTIEKNVISGNEIGVRVNGSGAVIRDNLMGIDPTGQTLVGAARYHVEGWSFASEDLLITGNVMGGAYAAIRSWGFARAEILQNYIGVTPSGIAIPNSFGISMAGGISATGTNNVISRNRIAYSSIAGVAMFDGRSSMRNRILNNVFHDNNIAIDLGEDFAPTPNDPGDEDIGTNGITNFPVIGQAFYDEGALSITGSLSAQANLAYTIELYVSGACHPSGSGEGSRRVTTFSVTTDGAGFAFFDQALTMSPLPAGSVVTATATSLLEGTSEFSACKSIDGPGAFSFTQSFVQVAEGQSVDLTVQRTGGSIGAATVQYASADDVARAPSDYTPLSGTLEFADGETSKTVTVATIQDLVHEGFQPFTMTLSNASGGAILEPPAVVTVQIVDDEMPPHMIITPVSKPEGNSGHTPFDFIVQLSSASEFTYEPMYTTSSNSAFVNSDFVNTNGTLTFNPGETQKTITVPVVGDTVNESDETFYVNVFGNSIGSAFSFGTIRNDDSPPLLSVQDITVIETDGTSTAVLTLTSDQPVFGGIFYQTANGTARAPGDYTAQFAALNLSGETEWEITIPIRGDDVVEAQEAFEVRFSHWFGAFRFDPKAIVTIADDDIGVGPDRMSIPIGQTHHGMIQLGGPVAADTPFLLASSLPSAVSVPAQVVIPAGASSVEIPIQALALTRGARVTVAFPGTHGGGTADIHVSVFTPAALTLSPAELTLFPGQTVTIQATLSPANSEPVTVHLSEGDGKVEFPEDFVILPGGTGSFQVKALANGMFLVRATLPSEYGNETAAFAGRVEDAPTHPAIHAISPSNGSAAGGTNVELTGALLRTDCSVAFGGVPASAVRFVSSELLSVTTPAHAPGVVDVVLTCGSDSDTLARAFVYRGAGPIVSQIEPSSGSTAGGTYVRISGTDFLPSCWPFFDDVAAPHALVRDDMTITAVAPPNSAGAADVRLLCTGVDALLEGGFTYRASDDPAAQITSIEPLFGSPGEVVTIHGSGFRADDGVTFGGVPARVLDSTPDTHVVVIPDVEVGEVSVDIVRDAGTITVFATGPIFTVGEAGPPRVSRVTPAQAPAGAEVTLEGTALRAPYTFAFGGQSAQLVLLLPTRAVVRLPAGLEPGSYPTAVLNAAKKTASLGPAVVVTGGGVVVTGVAGTCSATDGGIDVTITGSGFAANAAVTFDGIPATNVTVVDSSTIKARVPANAAGPAQIVVTNTDGTYATLTDVFRYASPFDPNAGCTASRTRSVAK